MACSGLAQVPEYLRQQKHNLRLIFNDDELCGQRCLVLAMSDEAKIKNLMEPARAAQFQRAAQDLGVRISVTGAMTFPGSFIEFTAVFQDYAVYIFDGPGNCCYAVNMDAEKRACLFYDRRLEHFHYVKTPDP